MRRVLLLPIAGVVVAAAAILVLGSDHDAPPTAPSTGASSELDRGGVRGVAETHVVEVQEEREELDRMAIEMGIPELADEDAEDGAALVVRGRVVAKDQAPVPGATVRVGVRRNVRALFENGGRGGRGGDADWQATFRQRDFGKQVVTGADGTFRLAGRTFTRGAAVEIAVTHDDFAPAVENRDWQPEMGELAIPDIVLGAGSLVTGLVTGPFGTPVAAATVRIELQFEGRGGPDGQGAVPGGPGGPGGGGPRGRGPDGAGLRALLPEATTDHAGRFAFTHVPAGAAVFSATAPRHVDGRSARTQLEDGLRVDVGEVKLGPGAELTGIVLDEHDAPIANATVTASLFREPGANDSANDNVRGRGDGEGAGRRGRGGPPGVNEFGRGGGRQTATTHTDQKGRFLLDRVPAAELSIAVRHERFVDVKQEPIDPRQQPRVELRMTHRPAVVGTVVDAATGEPVELFGIRWRREPGDEFRRGAQMLGGRLQEMLADPARAEEAQRFQDLATQFETQLRRVQDDRRARLGGAGIVPGSTPKPTTHAKGSFRLEDIEPGEFVLDVDAPGYVKIASGPFQVGTEAVSAPLVVRLERGSALHGKVVASHTGQTVAGARVTLALPEVQNADFGAIEGLGGMMRGTRGQGGGLGGGGGPFGGRGGREVLAQARTDRDGRFELPTLRAGTYSLTIRAEGFPEFRDPELLIGTNTAETVLRIDPGAHLFGTVIGLEPGTRATLELSHIENRDRRTVRVDQETHEYSVEGLAAGGWTIQIVGEGDRGSFRQRLGALLGVNNGAAPDVVVAAGSEQRHDIDASMAQPAVVEGQVFRNGSPGSGLEVRLVAETAGVATEATESPFGRMGRGGGRMLRANVGGSDGRYRIDSVPPGAYRLEVWERGGGGGGRGQGGGGGPRMRSDKALSQMSIEVRKGQSTTFNLTVATGLVHLAVNRSDGTAINRVTVSFALAGEAGELPPDQWSKLPSFRSVSVRGGDVDLGEIPAGTWSYSVTTNGAQPLRGTLSVSAGGAFRIDGSLAPATEQTAANGGR